MESQVGTIAGRRGFALVTVMIITAIGLLFGAAALLLFRFQCQLRIERQHELEKLYAVRSAMNYMRTVTSEADIPESGKTLSYHTGSGRDLSLLVKPVEAIFPATNNVSHFIMERGDFPDPAKVAEGGAYSSYPDFEYGMSTPTNCLMSNVNKEGTKKGFSITDQVTTSNTCWWVNIGMRDTGGWVQEDYGRRYYFYPYDYVTCGATQDIVRLCLIRNVTNDTNAVGRRHGWPLSMIDERALVLEICSCVGNSTNNAELALYEYVHTGASVNASRRLLLWQNCPSACYLGLQLADDKASLFYISNAGVNDSTTSSNDDKTRGFTFSDTVELSQETYRYFAQDVVLGGIRYGGIYTNDEGVVRAPELRAVFEIERKACESVNPANVDFLSYFRVKPAYQYDIFIENPPSMSERATVAQKIGTYNRSGLTYSMFTYDSHGTANRGFRTDERNFERSRTR